MEGFDVAAFVNALPTIVLHVANDEHYTLKFANTEAARMLGYDPAQFFENKDYTAASVVHPLDLDLLEKMDEYQARTGDTVISRYRLIDATGKEVPVIDVSRGTFDADGKCTGFNSVIIDIRKAPMLHGPSGQLGP